MTAAAATRTSARSGLADALRAHPHNGGIIVHPERRFIYMKAGKTAGTAIFRKVLEPGVPGILHRRGDRRAFRHWLRDLTDADLAEYYIFSVVRNPWDRFLSLTTHFLVTPTECLDTFDAMAAADRNFEQHAHPQVLYTHLHGASFCDRIARVETLQADMAAIFADLDLPFAEIPVANANPKRPPRDTLTDTEITRIGDRYAADVAAYGYTPND